MIHRLSCCLVNYTTKPLTFQPIKYKCFSPQRKASFYKNIQTTDNSSGKVFVHLFQKVAPSRARSPCRRPQTAKLSPRFKTAPPRRRFGRSKFSRKRVGSSCGFPKENGGVSREARVAACRRQVLLLLHP